MGFGAQRGTPLCGHGGRERIPSPATFAGGEGGASPGETGGSPDPNLSREGCERWEHPVLAQQVCFCGSTGGIMGFFRLSTPSSKLAGDPVRLRMTGFERARDLPEFTGRGGWLFRRP